MKKLLTIFPIIVLVLILASCGGALETAERTQSDAPSTSLEDLAPAVDVHTTYDLKDNEGVYLLDVREQHEYDEKHIPDITLLPMSEIESRLNEIPTDKEVIITCRSGNRSGQVAEFLRQNGFDNVHNMEGGIIAWEEAGYPVEQ